MLDPIIEPFQQGIAQRALVELVLIGAVAGPLGVWIVLNRQSYAAESISHAMLPGLALAAIASIPLGIGAAAGLAVAALLIALASRHSRVGPDVAVAVTVTGLFGLGALLALSPDVPLRLGELLFGDPLAVSDDDLIASALLALLTLAVLLATRRSLTIVGFDPQAAASLGASTKGASIALLSLVALTVLIAVQALGNLLVVAILIAPGAAALRVCERLTSALIIAGVIAIAVGISGIYLSYYVNLAAGASIALCACAAYAASLPFDLRRGSRTGMRAGTVSEAEG